MPERPVDLTAALAWASSEVGSPVVTSEPLEGGLTSTMLALRHADGSESVLRLMTDEPWRTHGAELTARERDAQLGDGRHPGARTDQPGPRRGRRRGGRGRAPDVPPARLGHGRRRTTT